MATDAYNPMSSSPAPSHVELALDEHGRIDADLLCRSCGYSLRGLAMAGVCPECSTPVGRSVHGDLLRFSDPAWVRQVASGAKLLVVAIIAGIVIGVIATAVAMTLAMSGRSFALMRALLLVLIAPVVVLQILAYWRVTAADPGQDESARPINARTIARYALLISSAIGLAMMPLDFDLRARASMPAAIGAAITGAGLIGSALGYVGAIALFLYARMLALRLPDEKLARHTRIVMWGLLVPGALMQILQYVQMFTTVPSPPPPPPGSGAGSGGAVSTATPIIPPDMYECTIFVLLLPALVFWIWSIVLCFQYRNRLMKAAAEAQRTWAAAESAATAST